MALLDGCEVVQKGANVILNGALPAGPKDPFGAGREAE